MDKTVTATFDSVDAATFAARRITSHFDEVRTVKINYRKLDRAERTGSETFALTAPAALAASQSANGMAPVPAGGIAPLGAVLFAQDGSDRDDPPPARERARVQITADARIAGKVEASLLGSGGWDLRTS